MQIERTFVCVDTGAVVEEPTEEFLRYKKYAFYTSICF